MNVDDLIVDDGLPPRFEIWLSRGFSTKQLVAP